MALSTVVTTLIILVVSVLLAGVVTYFAINVVSTRSQQESLQISDAHIWVDSAGTAEGAFLITNTGGRDVVISQITVRGQSEAFATNVFYATLKSPDTLPNDLSPIAAGSLSGAHPFTGTASSLGAAPGELVLASGGKMAIYITGPDSVTINDVGTSIAVTVFSAQAMYYQETNVQATTVTL